MANQTIVDGQETATAQNPIDFIINESSALIGGERSPRARDRALRFVDRAAARLNLAGVYMYRRKEFDYTTSSTPAFTDGATELTMPSDFAWPVDPFLVLGLDGETLNRVEWLPWEVFRALNLQNVQNSFVNYASINGGEANDRTIYVYPPIDADKTGTLRVTYFTRVPKPSLLMGTDAENLAMSEETLEALLTGTEYFVMRHRFKHNPQAVLPYLKEFDRVVTQAKGAAARIQDPLHVWARPDESGRASGYTDQAVGRRTTYIRI